MTHRPTVHRRPFRWPLLGAAAILACSTTLAAQTTTYRVTHYGQASGKPADLAQKIELFVDLCTTKTSKIVIRGGLPLNTAGLAIGVQKLKVPILGAMVLQAPLAVLTAPFDSRGEAVFDLGPYQTKLGAKFLLQAVHAGRRGNETVFVLSQGAEVEVVKTADTSYRPATAKTMAQICIAVHDSLQNRGLWSDRKHALRAIFDQQRLSTTPPLGLDWQIVDHIDEKSTQTQLVIAKNDTGDLCVAFQPSKLDLRDKDWATNFNAAKDSHYHKGFITAYRSIAAKLADKLRPLTAALPSKSRFYFTGWSLGGALATIASYELQPWLCRQGYDPSRIVLYSFEAPRSLASTHAPFAGRVPHHWAVACKDDLVTHVPPWGVGFTHVPRMIYLPAEGPVRQVNGNLWRNDDFPRYPLANIIDTIWVHQDFLRRILTKEYEPTLRMSVSRGDMQLNWSYALLGDPSHKDDDIDLRAMKDLSKLQSSSDYVALYRNSSFDRNKPRSYLPPKLPNPTPSWQFASGSTWKTGWPKGRNFAIAYVQQSYPGPLAHSQIRHVVRGYVPDYARLSLNMTKPAGKFVTLHWSYGEKGRFDWVGLFKGRPTHPKQVLCKNSWGWALSKSSHQTNWYAARDLYIGYVEQDDLGVQGKIVKVAGPFNFLGAPTVRLTWPNLWPYMLQLNWTNARVGTNDWVAIYDRDPATAGARRLHWNYATGSSWVPTLVPWKRGYYAAHFEQDCPNSAPKLVAKYGPL